MAVEEAAAAAGKRKPAPGGGVRGGKRRRRTGDWAQIPDDILFCIFRAVVLSGSAAGAFAAVCRPWRALAAASRKALASATPPLLLRPDWGEAAMCPAGPVAARRRWRPGRARPRLRAASPGAAAAGGGLLLPLPPRFLRTRAVCQSRGYLITVDRSTSRPALTNPLTGEELRPFPPLRDPPFPDAASSLMIGAVLGDPASPAAGCRIVLYCADGSFRTCVSGGGVGGGTAAWDTTYWDMLLNDDYIVQLAVVRGRVHALLSSGDLLLFDFRLSFHHMRLPIEEKPSAFRLEHKMGPYLVEHDGKAFTVHCTFVPSVPGMVEFRVCRLVRRRWVEQGSLDGMALFVDARGSAVLRSRPGGWGGKENHVYASGGVGMDGRCSRLVFRSDRRIFPWTTQSKLTGRVHAGCCHARATRSTLWVCSVGDQVYKFWIDSLSLFYRGFDRS